MKNGKKTRKTTLRVTVLLTKKKMVLKKAVTERVTKSFTMPSQRLVRQSLKTKKLMPVPVLRVTMNLKEIKTYSNVTILM